MPRKLTEQQQKKRILAVLSSTDNLSEALESAGINRDRFRTLCAENVITQQELADCKSAYEDRVLTAANKAALDGVAQPMIKYGKVVVDGNNQPVMQQNYDLNALRFLMERLQKMHEKAKDVLTRDDIPANWRIDIDARSLDTTTVRFYTGTELDTIKCIQANVDERRDGTLPKEYAHWKLVEHTPDRS